MKDEQRKMNTQKLLSMLATSAARTQFEFADLAGREFRQVNLGCREVPVVLGDISEERSAEIARVV